MSVSGTAVDSIEKQFMVRSALLLVAGVQSEWLFVLLDQHCVNVVGMCGRRWPLGAYDSADERSIVGWAAWGACAMRVY